MSEYYDSTTIESEWREMLSSAKLYFESSEQKKYEYHQCLVLKTADGEQIVYSIATDCVDSLKRQACSNIGRVIAKNNNTIKKIVCMWQKKTLDVPSSDFMKKLCEINKENKNAVILLSAGPDIYLTKKIENIIFT